MGTSYVSFKEKGFWSSDSTIELWKNLVVQEIDKVIAPSDWLQALRERWYTSTQGYGVGINPISLDQEITTEEPRQNFVTIVQAALITIEQYGGFIPKAVVETFPTYWDAGWISDVDTTNIKYFGVYFLKLLNGEYPLTGSDWGGRIEYLSEEKAYERWSLLVQQKNSSS